MLFWSLDSHASGFTPFSFSLWALCMSLGIWLGSLTTRKLAIKFDKQQKLIKIDGTWVPLVLSISIFSLRYFLAATHAIHPEWNGHIALLSLKNVATVVSGMFTGRLVGFWQQYKTAAHTDLIPQRNA
jgi:hypothetical protein